MRSGPSALQGSIRLGRLRLPRLIPPTFLQPWSLLRKALIRAAKTSHTAETLCDIPPKIYLKIIEQKLLDNNIRMIQ
jgi:hypothetical protein